MKRSNLTRDAFKAEMEKIAEDKAKLAQREAAISENLETFFREECAEATSRIDALLKTAKASLEQALKISDDTGIPFISPIMEQRGLYIPSSFRRKWANVDSVLVEELTNVSEYYQESDYGGWADSYC